MTGLSDWHTLSIDVTIGGGDIRPAGPPSRRRRLPRPAAPAPTPTPAAPAEAADPADAAADPRRPWRPPDPAGSDLWVDETTGNGSAELVWTPRDGRWTLLAAATGEDPGP